MIVGEFLNIWKTVEVQRKVWFVWGEHKTNSCMLCDSFIFNKWRWHEFWAPFFPCACLFLLVRCIQSKKDIFKLLFSDLQKTGTNIQICTNICFYVVRVECSLCCRPSPGSHCHTSVECRSSAPIDLEAHDPIFKVQRAPLLWFLLLLKQATAQERE